MEKRLIDPSKCARRAEPARLVRGRGFAMAEPCADCGTIHAGRIDVWLCSDKLCMNDAAWSISGRAGMPRTMLCFEHHAVLVAAVHRLCERGEAIGSFEECMARLDLQAVHS